MHIPGILANTGPGRFRAVPDLMQLVRFDGKGI
jgi:hypothetical protein